MKKTICISMLAIALCAVLAACQSPVAPNATGVADPDFQGTWVYKNSITEGYEYYNKLTYQVSADTFTYTNVLVKDLTAEGGDALTTITTSYTGVYEIKNGSIIITPTSTMTYVANPSCTYTNNQAEIFASAQIQNETLSFAYNETKTEATINSLTFVKQ